MKKVSRIADCLLITGFLFWQIETFYFLYKYGWHYRPYNEIEKTCDDIASIMMSFGLVLYLYLGTRVVKKIIDDI